MYTMALLFLQILKSPGADQKNALEEIPLPHHFNQSVIDWLKSHLKIFIKVTPKVVIKYIRSWDTISKLIEQLLQWKWKYTNHHTIYGNK